MNAAVPMALSAAVGGDHQPDTAHVEGMALFDVDQCGLVIVGRGHPRDLAAQIMIENGRDWRRLERLERRFLESLPGLSRASTIAPVRMRGRL